MKLFNEFFNNINIAFSNFCRGSEGIDRKICLFNIPCEML